MNKSLTILGLIFLSACSTTPVTTETNIETEAEPEKIEIKAILPIEDYAESRNFKAFGEYISDRFTGYHVGDDIEYSEVEEDVRVYAIADGEVTRVDDVSGYGGLITIRHEIDGQTITALYGHVDLSSATVENGDRINLGEYIANLGDHESDETDGERKHLHFALYEGDDGRIQGYEQSASAINNWINPQDFFTNQGMDMRPQARMYDPTQDLGGELFNLEFEIPHGMELEYIPSIKSLNIFALNGPGSARERSQFFIRYFDAADFLTLNTVTIHSTEDLEVAGYTARRYDITKKPGVADFPDQPSWRNERHLVTDFRASEDFTRYFVVAANPNLQQAAYESFLESMNIKASQ